MYCPYCGNLEDKVVDSRASKEGRAIRRRRECLECKKRFTTYEYIEETLLNVVKNNGAREPFDREKLKKGLMTACKKRPIHTDTIDEIIDTIERELMTQNSREVDSKQIGMLVIDQLKKIDEVAYVRFASVYRKFKDKQEFMDELKGLLK